MIFHRLYQYHDNDVFAERRLDISHRWNKPSKKSQSNAHILYLTSTPYRSAPLCYIRRQIKTGSHKSGFFHTIIPRIGLFYYATYGEISRWTREHVFVGLRVCTTCRRRRRRRRLNKPFVVEIFEKVRKNWELVFGRCSRINSFILKTDEKFSIYFQYSDVMLYCVFGVEWTVHNYSSRFTISNLDEFFSKQYPGKIGQSNELIFNMIDDRFSIPFGGIFQYTTSNSNKHQSKSRHR